MPWLAMAAGNRHHALGRAHEICDYRRRLNIDVALLLERGVHAAA